MGYCNSEGGQEMNSRGQELWARSSGERDRASFVIYNLYRSLREGILEKRLIIESCIILGRLSLSDQIASQPASLGGGLSGIAGEMKGAVHPAESQCVEGQWGREEKRPGRQEVKVRGRLEKRASGLLQRNQPEASGDKSGHCGAKPGRAAAVGAMP